MRIPLALCLLVLASSAAANVEDAPSSEQTRAEWRDYWQNDTDVSPRLNFPHARCFRIAAHTYDLPETLLLAVARGESDFDADARSRANAHGVMQIQWPGTAKHLGIYRLSNLYDPCTNIDAGARYLRELLGRYDGDLHLALAAYNYGPGRIAPGATRIPSGAAWYSAYIYRHLDYVLGDRLVRPTDLSRYSALGKTVLISFGEPYRAQAFVQRIEAGISEADAPLQVDWFRKGVGRFDVVYTYADKDDFQQGSRVLSRMGFALQ